MSCQKGNASRTRSQKHQNQFAFKNNLHDKSHKTKFINNIEIANVCERCKKILDWKIKYKKYKPLKAPAKCTKCDQKAVKHAYHIMCVQCAKSNTVCPKCGEKAPIVEAKLSHDESIKLDAELQTLLKSLPERKRRTFIRYMNRKDKKKPDNDNTEETTMDKKIDISEPLTRNNLLEKLKSLKLKEEEINNSDTDFDDEDDLDAFF